MFSTIKTIFLLGILSVIVITLGRVLGGEQGLLFAFFIALIMNGGMYFFSDKIALSMSGAKPLDHKKFPHIVTIIKDLTQKMHIPMPDLYITPDRQANAFATGRGPGHASVAVTQGILETLNKEELKGVLAHEMSHIKNRDVLVTTIAAVLASIISYLANMALFSGGRSNDEENAPNPIVMLVAALVIPIAATFIQLAISRQREYGADYTGAKTLGNGKELANALLAISETTKKYPKETNPSLSSLYIGDPTGGFGGIFMKLMATHPPIEERVKRLLTIK